jgi:predicted TIM-barrel fold metal-dependent hydrolase
MTATIPLLGDRPRHEVWPGSLIDVDIHAEVPAVEALFPYLAEVWHQHFRERGFAGPVSFTYPPGLEASARPEWRPTDGRPAASEVSLVREHVLDAWEADFGILNCYYPLDLGHPDLAAALASAVNDWLIAEWLERDSRLRASIVIPGEDPAAMVKEIERVGDHPGFVQVLMPIRSNRLLGQRVYFPVYEAMARHDLVLGLHFGGFNDGRGSTPSGFPSWYVEEYAAEQQVYEAQLLSIIAGGVFQAVPDLRAAMLEGGFVWLPTWCWRMDKEWKGMRREIPWVNRSPFSIIRDHMRFSVAPMDAGPLEELARTIGWLGSEDLLMFATDYPHMHDDSLATLLKATPESMRPKLMADSARAWYRL